MLKIKNRKKPNSIQDVMDLAGNILAWSVLILCFVGLPLYLKNGYQSIASGKYLFLMNTGKYIVLAAIIYFAVSILFHFLEKEKPAEFNAFSTTELCLLAFLLLAFISHCFSDHKSGGEHYLNDWFFEGSFYGTKGWFMGLASWILFAVFYFVTARTLIFKKNAFLPALIAVFLICIWGILNRYCIAPIDLNYDYSEGNNLASLGNINWFAGYTSVICPLGWGLYIGAKETTTKERIIKGLLVLFSFISFYMTLINHSDSGIVALAVVMAVLLGFSLTEYSRLKAFFELFIYMLLAASVVGLADYFPNVTRTGKGGILDGLYGIGALVLMLFALVTYFLLLRYRETFPKQILDKVKKAYFILLPLALLIYIIVLAINTAKDGALITYSGDSSPFFFNGEWGSRRGYTWTYGLKLFGEMDFVHKLIGSGPDTLYMELCRHKALFDEIDEIFYGARLTNAHNEFITLLVNNGIFGLAAFICILISAVKKSFEYAKENVWFVSFALAVIGYSANNFFSFEQVTNTPLLFLILGIEAAAVKDIAKSGATLTKSVAGNTIQKGKKKRK